jgi:hypothetical protein
VPDPVRLLDEILDISGVGLKGLHLVGLDMIGPEFDG